MMLILPLQHPLIHPGNLHLSFIYKLHLCVLQIFQLIKIFIKSSDPVGMILNHLLILLFFSANFLIISTSSLPNRSLPASERWLKKVSKLPRVFDLSKTSPSRVMTSQHRLVALRTSHKCLQTSKQSLRSALHH